MNIILTGTVLDTLPTGLVCLFFVLALITISQAGLSLFSVWSTGRQQPQNNEVTGIMFGAVSLIYSLILTFVIVAVWEDYNGLNKTIATEADKINSIIVHSSGLPAPLRKELNTALSAYCDQVINREWKMQSKNAIEQASAVPAIRNMLLRTLPQNSAQANIFSVIDDDLSSISDLRRERLSHSHSQVPGLVWGILETGSLMVIIFSYFFHVSSPALKRIYLAFLTGCVGMCMFLVYALDHPFNGSAGVSNKPYQNVQVELVAYRDDRGR